MTVKFPSKYWSKGGNTTPQLLNRAMLGKAVLLAGATLLVLGLPVAAAGQACEETLVVGVRSIEAGDCLRVLPGGTVQGPLTVTGQLLIDGTLEDPVLVEGPIRFEGGRGSITHAEFSPGATLSTAAPARNRVDLVVSDTTFRPPDGTTTIVLTGPYRAEFTRAAFEGDGLGLTAQVAAEGTSLSVTESRFGGPGRAIELAVSGSHGARISLDRNTFRSPSVGQASYGGEFGLVAVRGADGTTDRPTVVTSTGNQYEGGVVGLSLDAPNYRFLSTSDTFRANGAAVLLGQEGRNAIFDRTTFLDTIDYDLVLPSTAEATLKDPIRFDSSKVFISQGSAVTLEEGKSRTRLTYDWMLDHRAATASAAVGLAILGFGASSVGRSLFTKFLFVPLYARLSPEDVLNHEKRQEILAFVRDNPGVHLRRIGHLLSISYGTLTYHLYRLEREGYITFAQEGLFKRYYSTAGRMKEVAKEKPMPTALRDLERQIYETILANPGSAQSHLAQKLGLSRQALHYHIKKLEKSGFISKVPQGRETLIYAAPTSTPPTEPEPANT